MNNQQNGAKQADSRWMAPWRANAAARADQTRLVAKSAVIEAGHTITSNGTFEPAKHSNCPRHGQLEALYGEVRRHTDCALDLCGKQKLESQDIDNENNTRRNRFSNWRQRYRCWRHQSETGSVSDAVYGHIHLADCAMIEIINENQLQGELPRIKSVVDGNLPVDHESRIWLDRLFDDLKCQHRKTSRSAANPRKFFRKTSPQVIGGSERAGILSALRTAYLQSAVNRNSLLSLQRMMRTVSFALLGLLIVLGFIGLFEPNTIPVCARECPTGSNPGGGDIFLVELIGVFAATLAGGLTLIGRREPDIFRMRYSQIGLKAVAGGATAVLGLVLLLSIASNMLTLNNQLGILAFAALFGYSQEAFTRLVDGRVDVLRKSVTPPSTRTPLELSAAHSPTE